MLGSPQPWDWPTAGGHGVEVAERSPHGGPAWGETKLSTENQYPSSGGLGLCGYGGRLAA